MMWNVPPNVLTPLLPCRATGLGERDRGDDVVGDVLAAESDGLPRPDHRLGVARLRVRRLLARAVGGFTHITSLRRTACGLG